jgi:hypothetical protein
MAAMRKIIVRHEEVQGPQALDQNGNPVETTNDSLAFFHVPEGTAASASKKDIVQALIDSGQVGTPSPGQTFYVLDLDKGGVSVSLQLTDAT